ncbi:MAG: S8 family serine peptidase [Clostridia bacterium]|nr:S8 family serine peptidase [Clostridia bacterium]
MKKLFVTLIFFICAISCIGVNARESNGYIVKLKDNSFLLMSDTDELSHIGDNLYRADNIDTLYSTVSPEDIETVFPDYEFELFDMDYPYITSDTKFDSQWYLDTIKADSAREKGISGNGVKIAVIDSGINISHPDFEQSNILQGYNCTFDAEDINDCTDNVGHGTMVAGIIAAQTDNELDISGIAGGAQIIPIKITDTNSLSMSSIFLGIEKALETDCDVINMSFGGAITDENALAVLKSYIDQAEERGIIVVAAVGNSGHIDNVVNYPAGFDNVIGVGSINEDLTSSYFSQKNESVFLSAPGDNIISLSASSSVTTGLGTSLSAPIVTAAVAIIKEVRPDYSPGQIRELLKNTCVDYGATGYDVNYGYGILNIKNILNELSDDIPDFIVSQGILDSNIRIHIHNNSGNTVVADMFFASYDEECQEGIQNIKDVGLAGGVTNITIEDNYERLFIWDKNLRPYAKKYLIKQQK